MNMPTIEQVDQAVRAVLASRSVGQAIGRAGAWNFVGRVLSARQVEQLGMDVERLAIPPETVVTPMAKEALKDRGIQVHVSVDHRCGPDAGEWALAIEPGWTLADSLKRGLRRDGPPWIELEGDVESVAAWTAEGPHRNATLITSEASVACWRAHRIPGCRAAAIQDAERLRRAHESLGLNLAVIEHMNQSLYEIQNLLRVYRRLGPPAPPEFVGNGFHVFQGSS